ncbi:hypothetical protein DSAG12_01401 [Promethearchaeum syntrophicum]|uniref:Uncharacterized protein n=1 Tax=Promethearchaeum syntrophicum TaxID=2594042 RepID=A0A5B9D9B3_9ARCH|nr:hypothetical protein [Candidatus Prometheoarchaeum syntrophicum]QEE15575.1 hypothetical protein DSAG12_01401 [Candidatus Prometheoarchaeum syntrophicum]
MSYENKEESTISIHGTSKIKIKHLVTHPYFFSDFRQTPINWVLIILSVVSLIFVFNTDRWYFLIGIPIFIALFIFLILFQGEWQRFNVYYPILDVVFYGFIIVDFIILCFFNIFFSLSVIFLILKFKNYLVDRENRIASAMKGLYS